MKQEELKEQALNYIQDNLNEKSRLEVAKEILDDLSNSLYIEGNIYESTELTTCYLKICNVLDNN